MGGIVSPAREALHRLPPRLALPWIPVPPTSLAASMSPGKAAGDFRVPVDPVAGHGRPDREAGRGVEGQCVQFGNGA